MPNDLWIAVTGCLIGQNGIACIFRERPAVETVSDALDGWIARRRVDEHKRGDAILAETACIMCINDGAAAEHRTEQIGREGIWQFCPMEQVFADGVPPMHIAPIDAVRVVFCLYAFTNPASMYRLAVASSSLKNFSSSSCIWMSGT